MYYRTRFRFLVLLHPLRFSYASNLTFKSSDIVESHTFPGSFLWLVTVVLNVIYSNNSFEYIITGLHFPSDDPLPKLQINYFNDPASPGTTVCKLRILLFLSASNIEVELWVIFLRQPVLNTFWVKFRD